jgi:hypothetical protein
MTLKTPSKSPGASALLNPMTVPVGQAAIDVTASAGLVWTIPGHMHISSLLLPRDREMYEAKRSGEAGFHPPLTITEVSSKKSSTRARCKSQTIA